MSWQTFRFLMVVLLPAAVLMALEMVSSRILAPHFGNSVYVWGSIIGVFLAAMSIGYSWGGRLADQRPELFILGRLLLCASALQLLVMTFGTEVVAMIGDWTAGSPSGTLLATLVLFAPPTVFLSTVAPFAIKLATRDLSMLGGTSGQLYALSTGGSLVGTLGATFMLIPHFPLDTIFTILVLGTLIPALAALTADLQHQRPWILLALSLVVVSMLQPRWRSDDSFKPLADRITAYQSLQVYDQNGLRYLVSDGTRHSAIELATGETALPYSRQTSSMLLLAPPPKSLLVLGMGGGNAGTFLHRHLPNLEVDYVEIDPAVADLAEQFMGFQPSAKNRVHIDDARRFLENSDRQWDSILVDTYIGASVPFHLTTVEFFQQVRKRLAPDGVLGVNLVAGPESPFASAMMRSVHQSFPFLSLFGVRGSGNYLLLAKIQPMANRPEDLLAKAQELDAEYDFSPDLQTILRWRQDFDLDLTRAQLLTDRFAPANHLLSLDRKTTAHEPFLGPPSTEQPSTEPSATEPSATEPSATEQPSTP